MTISYITSDENNQKTILVHNVQDINKLEIDAKGIEYDVYATEDPNKLAFRFEPHNNEVNKMVSMKYNGSQVKGTPVILRKRLPSIEHNADDNVFTLRDVDEGDKIRVKSSKGLNYNVYSDVNDEKTFHVSYENPGDLQNNVFLKYGDKNINKTAFKIGNVYEHRPGELLLSSRINKLNDDNEVHESDLPLLPSEKDAAKVYNLNKNNEHKLAAFDNVALAANNKLPKRTLYAPVEEKKNNNKLRFYRRHAIAKLQSDGKDVE
ncbi:hypothetical protein MHBO_003385 [Bonamia ostreae]|uniref:Uncharacterized protein n=1 Tax=Bonamia ostreae TaxID=126728 RepID=A0ABV2AQA5_9EUKA